MLIDGRSVYSPDFGGVEWERRLSDFRALLAPGVDVARVDANRWAISIRGFSDQHANKILVLMLGQLTDSFNAMLAEIQERDRELLCHRERLEQEVTARRRNWFPPTRHYRRPRKRPGGQSRQK